MTLKKPLIEVLLIEDNVPDVELLKFLFGNCGVPINFTCAYDGSEGSDCFFKRDKFADRPSPDLVIMDLNLPRKDGRELLKEFKADKELGKVPIIMVSTSNSQKEISEAYSLGANAFISKPADIDVFQATVNALVEFWFVRIDLPTRFVKRG